MKHRKDMWIAWVAGHIWWLFLVVLAFGLGCLVGWLHLAEGTIVWGTAGEWVSGLVTAGALLLALHVFLTDRESRNEEQARLVNAWLDDELRLLITNGSNQPVYRFGVAWFDPVAHERTGTPATVYSTHILPPGTPDNPDDIRLPARMGNPPSLTVEFVDARNVLWRRAGGQLAQVSTRVTYEDWGR